MNSINLHKLSIIIFSVFLLCSCGNKTSEENGVITVPTYNIDSLANGHEFVDLGICNGLKWATMNVGATKPEEKGQHFAWGEVDINGKSAWNDVNYRYSRTAGKMYTKYITRTKFADHKYTLEPSDDAAQVNWGGAWRMPTAAEFDSLLVLCTWKQDTINGIAGFTVTGQRPGFENSRIFLPFTGARDQSSILNETSTGYYWSSSTLYGAPTSSKGIAISSEYHTQTFYFRYYGQAVRPVFLPGEVLAESIELDKEYLSMPINGGSFQLHATISPANVSNKDIKFDSSNISVAKVDETTGEVTPVGKGVCNILAITTDGTSKTDFCTVTIVDTHTSGHNYVDLGICGGLKWATTNVGAEHPEDLGMLLTWKDANAINWGEGWRLPTAAELDTLRNRCNWQWSEMNGVKGYKISADYLLDTLFLPAAGIEKDGVMSGRGTKGDYWSANLLPGFSKAAAGLGFDDNKYYWNYNILETRCSVRPVISFKK